MENYDGEDLKQIATDKYNRIIAAEEKDKPKRQENEE